MKEAQLLASQAADRRAWWLCCVGVLLLLALPFFFVDVPPVLDYPNHLARLYVLAFGADDPVLSKMYVPDWHVVPNLAVDIVGPPLLHVLPVHVAGRLILAGGLFLPLLGTIAYHRAAFGVRSYWPLAAGLAAFNGIFFLGFLNFLYAVGMALLAAALWIRNRERAPLAAVIGGAASAVVVFLCHIYGVMFLAALIGSQELARLWRLRRDQALTGKAIGSAVLLVGLALTPAVVLYVFFPPPAIGGEVLWDPVLRKIFCLFVPFLTYSTPLAALTGVCIGAVLILSWRESAFDRGSLIALVVLFAAYLVIPGAMNGGAFVAVRVPVMMGFLLFAGFRPRLAPAPARIAVSAIALLLVVRSVEVASAWYQYRLDVADLRRSIAHVEAGARVLVVLGKSSDPDHPRSEPRGRIVPNLARTDFNMGGLLTIEQKAFWPSLSADPALEPLAVLPPYDRIAAPNTEPPDYDLLALDRAALPASFGDPYFADWQGNFDYVLMLNAGAVPDLAAFLPDRLQLLNRSDEAALFRVRR